MGKGLVFVQTYAVYEYTVVNSLIAALQATKNHGLLIREVRPEFLCLVLHNQFESASGSGTRLRWERRIELFQRAASTDPLAEIEFEDVFPTDGSHFRSGQLETIWRLLGVSAPVVTKSIHLGRIAEMVEHRNAVAHGRDAPETVGRRFSDADIEIRIDDTEALCMHIADALELHSTEANNLRK